MPLESRTEQHIKQLPEGIAFDIFRLSLPFSAKGSDRLKKEVQ